MSAVVDGPTTLVQNTLVLVGSAGVLLYVNWQLALATLTVFPGMAIGTAIFRYYSGRAYRADPAPPRGGHRAAPGGHLGRARRPGLPARGHQLRAASSRSTATTAPANDQTITPRAIYFPYVDLLSALGDGRGARLRRHARLPGATSHRAASSSSSGSCRTSSTRCSSSRSSTRRSWRRRPRSTTSSPCSTRSRG